VGLEAALFLVDAWRAVEAGDATRPIPRGEYSISHYLWLMG
jgi:hypothetical protein